MALYPSGGKCNHLKRANIGPCFRTNMLARWCVLKAVPDLPCSFGFRPRRSVTEALEVIRVAFPRGGQFVFEADIRDFFGSIDQDRLMVEVERRVSDPLVLKLIRQWLGAGVLDNGVFTENIVEEWVITAGNSWALV